MTVSTTTIRADHTTNGSTTNFAFSFPIFAETDLTVVHRNSDGTETPLALTTDYTVSASPWTSGGSITTTGASSPWDNGTLVIKNIQDSTQETDYTNGGVFAADSHENALDKLEMRLQYMQEQLNRCVMLPATEPTTTDNEIPSPTADEILVYNATANGFTSAAAADLSLLTVSTFMGTVLDDTTAGAARTTLGAYGASDNVSLGTIAAGNTAITGTLSATGATTLADLTLSDTTADALAGPDFILDRNSASPADNDVIGQVIFRGRNDAGTPEATDFASIQGKILDFTDGTEDGQLEFKTLVAGTNDERMLIGAGVMVGDGAADPGDGKINVENGYEIGGLAQAGWRVLATATPSGASTVDFDTGIDWTLDEYMLVFDGLVLSSTGHLALRTSTDNGSTYDTGGNYSYFGAAITDSGTTSYMNGTASTYVQLTDATITTSTALGLYGNVRFYNPSDASRRLAFRGDLIAYTDSGAHRRIISGGRRNTTEDNDGIQLLGTAGNITANAIVLLGRNFT